MRLTAQAKDANYATTHSFIFIGLYLTHQAFAVQQRQHEAQLAEVYDQD